MICQSCKKNEATIHYFESINGRSRNLNLCEDCAAGKGIENFSLPLASLEAVLKSVSEPGAPRRERKQGRKCVACGMTYADFRHNPAQACPACFDTFGLTRERKERVKNALKPEPLPGALALPEAGRSAGLRRLMEKAVELEQYEEAARLRDLIKEEEGSPVQ
jgi:protein arginine kinase activator